MNATPDPSEPLGVEDQHDSLIGATSAFVPLKLPAHWRKRTPPGFTGLDRVLDEVGCRMNPAEWGRLPGWDLLPFRYDSRRKAYRAKWGLRLVKGSPSVRSSPLATELKRAELRACARVYRAVCERTMDEFETSRLPPYALQRPWGQVEKIDVPGIWATQGEWAFYAGLVIVPGQYGTPVTARVLVRLDDLRTWSETQDNKGREQGAAEARRRVGRAIRDLMAETSCRPTKEQVRRFCENVMGNGTLSSKRAFDDVWDQIPSSRGGLPGKAAKAAVDAQSDALHARISAAWTGSGGERAGE